MAFADKPILFQTSGRGLCPDKSCLRFCHLGEDDGLGGEVPQCPFALGKSLNILALNGTALWHSLGAEKLFQVLSLGELCSQANKSLLDKLNNDQRQVTNPPNSNTAVEAACLLGTGKTKVISELVRGSCTKKNVIIVSERNGAIDALANSFLSLCFQCSNKKLFKLFDFDLWKNVLTCDTMEGIGVHTKEFLLESKMKCNLNGISVFFPCENVLVQLTHFVHRQDSPCHS